MKARLLTCLLLMLALAGCRREEVEETIGYRGPARNDPSSQRRVFSRQKDGMSAGSIVFTNVPKHGGTVLTATESFVSFGDTELVMDWVEGGGHLILLLSGAERWRNDHKDFSLEEIFKRRKPEAEELKLLERLGVGTPEQNFGNPTAEKKELTIGRRKLQVGMPGAFSLKNESLANRAVALLGEKKKPTFISYQLGSGRVTVIAHAQPFRNRWIGENDHAALLAELARVEGANTTFCILNGVRVLLGDALGAGWMALIALFLILVFWLWKNFPRFGPVLLRAPAGPREFTEHLTLTGGFLWRHHAQRQLVAPLQQRVLIAATRHGLKPAAPDFFDKLSTLTGVPPGRVRVAMAEYPQVSGQGFLQMMQDLETLQTTL